MASIYQGSPIVDACNRITASVIQAYVEHRLRRDPEADITLLEIGAGTGGTSEAVLQAVAGYARNLRYLYTDVSKSFTEHGRERLGRRYPFISCIPLDIEQNPLAQGFEADSVDLVFGANVVHATRRIPGTLHRIKRLLKANGLFILNEVTHLETFNTLTFGLTEGWWRFEDEDIRIPHSPLLTADGWEAELAASGFQVVKRYPYPPDASEKPRQCILVGQSDGQVVCRQQEKAAPGKTAAVASAGPSEETRPAPEGGLLRKHAEDYLRKAIGGVLKRPASAIDVDTTFERYGIDSLLILEINKRFEADFGNLPTTLLFENRTVRRLADYFLSRHETRLNAMVGTAPRHASGQPPPETSSLEDTDPEQDKPHPLATPRPTPGVRVTAPAPDIAVIGMSGRYPMAETLDSFWENLKNGRNCVQEIPAERWDWRRHFDPSAFGKRRGIYSKWGGFITDVDKFDAPFFRISPREAKAMDPQERLFMECAWSVFEDAGYTRDAMEAERIGGEVGVFVGVMNGDYEWMSGALGTAVDAVDPHLAYWSIANRISYHMNLQGPSIAVDTACSASLTAVHLACESLRKGECRMALAGGVNLILHPRHYERLCRMQMLSKEGQCRSFGAGADGFVDGEGVGAVLLKPLDRAVADADSIYGVILGSAMNSGGKTSGYTVPNPNAQARLIQKALKQAGVKPETVSYVEAHGTGTALGDPVEVGGLSKAFGARTTQTAYCAIGSVKSNIGHLESAAGIAGLTKVMLQLKHRQLVPSIHSDPPNPHIDFDPSPFYVQKTLTNWDADGPRRAAVSSFGAGGANVHMVVEEYNGGEGPAAEDQGRGGEGEPRLFVLSAKDEERLREYAQNLVRFLDAALKTDPPPLRLGDMAYTFQIGREAMETRLAVVADDLQEIRTGLESYLNGEERPDHLHVGTADKRSLNPDLLTGGRVGQTFVRMLLEERDLDRVAQLWTLGLDFDWSQWYRHGHPMRISAPTYPFARNRYWLSRAPFAPEGSERGIAPFLDRVHPGFSVDRGVWFEKSLDPDHPLIRDHAVDHRRILPGSVYLEMACEAARSIRPNARFRLARGVWPRALVFGDQREDVLIQITESPSAGYRYAVRQGRGDASVIYAQGEIRFDGPSLPSNPQLPIGEIQARCSAEMTGDDFYRAIQEADIRYGPHFQGLSMLWTNPDEALGRISLPEEQQEMQSSLLHPVFVDNAFQVVAGLLMSEPSSFPGPVMPFSVDEVAVFRRVPTTGYAHVKKLGPLRFNLWITDDSGTVCATIREVNLRVSTPKASPFLYRPVWNPGPPQETPQPLDAEGSAAGREPVLVLYPESRSWLLSGIERTNPAARVFNIRLGRESKRLSDAHWSVDGSDPDALAACLKDVKLPGRVYHLGGLACGAEGVDEAGESANREQVGLLSLFRAVKALQDRGVADNPIEWKIFTADAHDPFHRGKVDPFSAAIHGFARSVANEHPKWRVSCTDVDAADIPVPASGNGALFRFWEDTDTVSAGNGFTTRAIRNGRIHVRRFEPIRPSADTRGLLKPNGVYLIVGGAGRIGRVLSDHLARAVKARLVWIGRRQVTADIQEEMTRIEAAGGRVRYVQADVTEHESLRDAVDRSKAHYGGLQGAFHCGMEENVQLIRDMDETAFRAVLAPKIRGSLILYRVLASEPLDFLIFFSSVQALIGDRGVGPYAAGCSFQDGFSQNRRPAGAFPVISIDWGYWKTALDEQPLERKGLIRSLGFHAIEDDQGADAVQHILSLGHPQVLAVKAADRLLERLQADTGVYWQSFPTLFPSILSETADHAMVSPPGSGDRERMQQAFEELNALGAKRLFHVLHEMGAFPPPDTWVEVSELKAHLGILPKYNRLVDTFIDILTRCGRIRREEDRLTVAVPVEATDRAIPDREVPEMADHVRLLETCLNRYPEILQGAVPAVEVMFPNASSDLIKGIYSGNPAANHYNRLVAAAVGSFIQARKRHLRPNERIRILEVGAGTGGTTAAVLPAVQSAGVPVDYDYTDISKGLLRTGHQRFGHLYPFVRFRTFDVETDVRLQGFTPGGYDLVLAANVLHATKNMNQTLENAKRLLKTHGLLVCNELTQAPTHILLTFGLLDGWWAFEDEAIRLPGSPLLSLQQWQTLLERTGFTPVRLPDSAVTWDPESSQEIILAESNGETRWNEKASRASEPLPARPSKPVRQRTAFPDMPFPKTADGRQTVVRSRLMQSLSQVLDIEPHEFDPDAAFTDFGVDSILSVEIINLLNDALSIRLRTTDLFNYPNIRELTDHILKTFGDEIPDSSETTDVQEPAAPGRLSRQDTDGQAGMLEILRAVHSGTMDLEEADQLLEAMNEN
ncbi:MAG: SDR family NAD(P)-dependent oxidoreductase [Desulfobacteraceae bacterium]|nr:SDR family NAD(P)-dependent oxidoreductase [Desulfobacteraceae bacterium]